MKKLQVNRHQLGSLPTIWVTKMPQKDLWMTQSDYEIDLEWTDEYGGTDTDMIYIPIHYRFDLASVPRIFWRLIAPFELSLVAPLVHDYLYEWAGCLNPQILPDGGHRCEKMLSRKQVDEIFLNLMERENVPKWRRNLAHKAVRVGGLRSWKKYKQQLNDDRFG